LEALDDEFHFLAHSVERAVDVQEKAATELLEVSLGRGVLLAQRLLNHYKRVRDLVDYTRESYKESTDAKLKQGAITEMRTLVDYARHDLQRCLGWLDAASEPVLDPGTRYLIEFLASQLVAPDSEATVVPTLEGSYSTLVGAPLDDADGDDAGQVPIVVFIPRREQHSGLLHPLIVHELGHAASRRHGLVTQLVERAKEDQEIQDAHAAAAQSVAAHMEIDTGVREHIREVLEIEPIDETDSEALTEAASNYLWAIARFCLEEAFCDAFAIQILGPTYLYAFAAIVGTSDLDLNDPQHPAARLRIELMLRQLDDLAWTDVLKQETPKVYEWFRFQADTKGPSMEPAPSFSAKVVRSLSVEVQTVASEHVNNLAFTPDTIDVDLRTKINRLLEVGIPPAQLQEPVSSDFTDGQVDTEQSVKVTAIDRPQVIFASWLFAIQQGGGTLEAIAKAPGLPELSLLLPKALELSALLRAWDGGGA